MQRDLPFPEGLIANVTPVILTFNEAANIARTLDQLTPFRDIVIVDSGSTDETVSIARRYPNVRLFTRPFDMHARQWQFAIHETRVRTEWVLALDADYVISDGLVAEIAALRPQTDVNGYMTRFRYCALGRPLRGSLYPPVTTLFRRELAEYVQDGHTQRLRLRGTVLPLSAPIYHDDRKPLALWLRAQDRYATLEADLVSSNRWADLRVQDKLRRLIFITPWLVPLYCLTVGRGLLDGWPGVYYALQRGIAEAVLALKLVEARLQRSQE